MDGEVALIEAAREGDRGAFGQLVERYERPVFSLAYRMMGNASDAEDAAQEAFFKAFRALGSYDAGRSFSTWLLSITAHHCIDRIRRRKNNEVSLDGMPQYRWQPGTSVDPQVAAERSGEAETVRAGLAALPEDYRVVVVLRYWHDLGYSEIASILGESESAIKSRLHRARRRLAEFLLEVDALPPARPADSGRGGAPAFSAAEGRSTCSAIAPAT